MKNLIALIISLFISAFMIWGGLSVVYNTVTGKWYFQSEIVKEPKFFGGEYIQINDTIRVVKKKSNIDDSYNTITVQSKLKSDSIWHNTNSHYYESQHLGKFMGLLFLQSEYEKKQSFFD